MLGSMLSIKPIIAIENGSLHIKEKPEAKKAKEKIALYLRDSLKKHSFKEVYILYGLHEVAGNHGNQNLNPSFQMFNLFAARSVPPSVSTQVNIL